MDRSWGSAIVMGVGCGEQLSGQNVAKGRDQHTHTAALPCCCSRAGTLGDCFWPLPRLTDGRCGSLRRGVAGDGRQWGERPRLRRGLFPPGLAVSSALRLHPGEAHPPVATLGTVSARFPRSARRTDRGSARAARLELEKPLRRSRVGSSSHTGDGASTSSTCGERATPRWSEIPQPPYSDVGTSHPLSVIASLTGSRFL